MERHNITITWENGDQTTTWINGSRMEICKYYENAVHTYIYDDGNICKETCVKIASLHFND